MIADILARVAHLLPAQGPIGVFIHHNPLHALEDLPFEAAVAKASELFGNEPFLPESRYRAELRRGRILTEDVDAVVDADLGERADGSVAGLVTRRELYTLVLVYGIPVGPHPQVEWLVRETDVLERMRASMPEAARARLAQVSRSAGDRAVLEALWRSCTEVARRADPLLRPVPSPRRHRDVLLAAVGADADDLVHPLLIRCCAAYLDQGVAHWPAPRRDVGFLEWFARLYGPPGIRAGERWLAPLSTLLDTRDAATSLERSLEALGVRGDEVEPFLLASALALRGWAGMIHQVEERPDRVPVLAPPATLAGFLAVRLVLDRAAAAFLAREHGLGGSLADLWSTRERFASPPSYRHPSELAWKLFHVAQLLGRTGSELEALSPSEAGELVAELDAFGPFDRRRLLHLAYERRHRTVVLDALSAHQAAHYEGTPPLQAIFCLDEREESTRRHLEEIAPECETFGAAGFFGVAMYYRGISDAHARPLCPIAIVPEHEVVETPIDPGEQLAAARSASRRGIGKLSHGLSVGSRTFVRGTVITALLGALAAIPLTLRVLFPRLTARFQRQSARLIGPTRRTRLALDRRVQTKPSQGRFSGLTKDEMARIVESQLETIGLTRRLAPLVLVVGHGSSSLNNPHESAHDCGACGGGHGGPNARAFAQMANDPLVRSALAKRGLVVPPETWFVGAEHNSCDDGVEYYDVDLVPLAARPSLDRIIAAMDETRRRDAHERCRRFDNVPTWLPPGLALTHVEGRSEDLAQVRPEYGHATNAVCVVGRRGRTRGLYLDRRAFLVSYDPTGDGDGAILARLLAAVVPVVAGISLEYWFGYVDPIGYGCGTKLPHNITALLGVMDGHRSDLRTGLPWQMLEIHEPVRLLIVVEARPEILERVIGGSPTLEQYVRNGWLVVASLDPDGATIHEHDGRSVKARPVARPELPEIASSEEWYRGERGHLPPAVVRALAGEESAS